MGLMTNPTERKVGLKNLLEKIREERGQDLSEYALLMVLVALAAIAAMSSLGATISKVYANADAGLGAAS